jgi:hypothetical protein
MLSSTTTLSPAEMTSSNAGPSQSSSAAHGYSGSSDVTTVNHQHGHLHQLASTAAPGTASGSSNLWGYSAPSPPGTATATSSVAPAAAPAARLGNSVAGSHLQQHAAGAHTSAGPPPAPSAMYNSNNPGFQGYNTGNT